MVLRWAKTGAKAGRKFWGCSMFAKTRCGGTGEVGQSGRWKLKEKAEGWNLRPERKAHAGSQRSEVSVSGKQKTKDKNG